MQQALIRTMGKVKRKPAPEMSEELQAKLLGEIGALLKQLRRNKTTQTAFAYETGMSPSQINNYENGGDMKVSTLLRILYGLEITPAEFFKKLG